MFHFVNSTSSPEQVGESLEDSFSAMCQSAPSNWKRTLGLSCSSDSGTGSYPGSPSGMMSAPLMGNHGPDGSMSSAAGSPARTFPQPARVPELTEPGLASGLSLRESLARFDRASSSWKTAPSLLPEASDAFLGTWPRWGSMRNGECWERTAPAWTIAATECGLLPTPLATDCKGGATAPRPDNGKLRMDQWRDYVKMKYALTYPHPTHSEIRLGWPAGWSDFAPLETDKFLAWQRLHGEPLTNFKDQAA